MSRLTISPAFFECVPEWREVSQVVRPTHIAVDGCFHRGVTLAVGYAYPAKELSADSLYLPYTGLWRDTHTEMIRLITIPPGVEWTENQIIRLARRIGKLGPYQPSCDRKLNHWLVDMILYLHRNRLLTGESEGCRERK
jgi:hypothetical protein